MMVLLNIMELAVSPVMPLRYSYITRPGYDFATGLSTTQPLLVDRMIQFLFMHFPHVAGHPIIPPHMLSTQTRLCHKSQAEYLESL